MGKRKTAGYVVEERGFGLCDICDYGDGYGPTLCHGKTPYLFPDRKAAERAINLTFNRAEKLKIDWEPCSIVRLVSAD